MGPYLNPRNRVFLLTRYPDHSHTHWHLRSTVLAEFLSTADTEILRGVNKNIEAWVSPSEIPI